LPLFLPFPLGWRSDAALRRCFKPRGQSFARLTRQRSPHGEWSFLELLNRVF
jgi:hypothetical protein